MLFLAAVSLFNMLPQSPPAVSGTITDRGRRYVIRGLDAGAYFVRVQKTGYVELDSKYVRLEPADRSFFTATLEKGAVIVGRIVDENGEAVAKIQVMVLRRPAPREAAMADQSNLPFFPVGQPTHTNDLGEFRIFGLAPGNDYFVSAIPDLFNDSPHTGARVLAPTYFPGTLDWRAAQPIALAAGQTSEIVIQMISVPAFQVAGVVTDENGRPVAKALVRLMKDDPQPFTHNDTRSHSDNSGRFTINNVTDGAYTLLAIAPVVTSRPPAPRDGVVYTGSFGFVGGRMGCGVTTEMTNGVTTEYRDDAGTRASVTVKHANVDGIEISVRRRPR